MIRLSSCGLPLGLAFLAGPALAHPGDHHNAWLATLLHLLSAPDHVALALVAVAAGIAGARALRSRRAAAQPQRRAGLR